MKNVTFYLGPAVGLTSRTLIITRMHRAGDDSAPAAEHNTDAGAAAENVTVALPDDTIWRAQLDDVSNGVTSNTPLLFFNTGSLQFPGPAATDGSLFRILSMEDLSSSSVSSASSSSSVSTSSVSSSSVSSSSQSSSSSSSVSSSSVSSSSISTSSVSSSSVSSSSSASSSSQSSSSSSSSSSVSSSSQSSSQSSGSSGLN